MKAIFLIDYIDESTFIPEGMMCRVMEEKEDKVKVFSLCTEDNIIKSKVLLLDKKYIGRL